MDFEVSLIVDKTYKLLSKLDTNTNANVREMTFFCLLCQRECSVKLELEFVLGLT
jgi:hypothetical protein